MGSEHLPRSRRPVDYYALLGVPGDATFRDIEQAYWQAAKTRRDLLAQLNEAYEVLGDPNRRLAYDEQRAASKDHTPAAGPLRPNPDRNKLRWYLQ
jgi:curved DNA-binding protein CbpA